jgi:hypothetical protein
MPKTNAATLVWNRSFILLGEFALFLPLFAAASFCLLAIEMVNIKILESLKLGGPKRKVFESDHEQNPFVQNNTNDFMGEAAYPILIRREILAEWRTYDNRTEQRIPTMTPIKHFWNR